MYMYTLTYTKIHRRLARAHVTQDLLQQRWGDLEWAVGYWAC
jgi:hypothetical protein